MSSSNTNHPPARATRAAGPGRPASVRRGVPARPTPAPATVWAPPPAAVGARWQLWVQTAIDRAFLPAGGRRIDLTDHLTDHLAAHPRDNARQHQHQPPHRDDGPDPARCPVLADQGYGADLADLADLAVVSLDGTDAYDRLGILAARTLRSGGILAVLTRCRHVRDTPGAHRGVGNGMHDARGACGDRTRLMDPTGTVVASAQNADLLYLQHIVIPTHPLPPADDMPTPAVTSHSGPTLPGPALPGAGLPGAAVDPPVCTNPTDTKPVNTSSAGTTRDPVEAAHRHTIAHADLLVFTQPSATPTRCAPCTTTPSGSTPSGSTPSGPPGLDSTDLHDSGRSMLQFAGSDASAEVMIP